MAGLLDDPMTAGLTQMAFGLLGASGPSARPVSLGQAFGAAGPQAMGAYRQAQEAQQQQQAMKLQELMKQLQVSKFLQDQQEYTQKMGEAAQRKQYLANYRNTLPEQDRALFDASPEEYLKANAFSKPQLVEIADPNEPLRTQKVWMKPGQNSGTVAGYGQMPEALDPRIQEGKLKVAAAGKPSVEQKVYNVSETEQAKTFGKGLGEVRANLMQAGFTAPSKLAQLDRMETLLQGVDGGKLAPLGMEVSSAARSLGLNIDPKLGNKEAAEALAREIAGSFRQPGSGPMTDKDFENFLKRVPDLSKTAAGRKQIFGTMRAALRRDIEASKLAREYARQRNGNIDDGFQDVLADLYARNPVVGNEDTGFKIIGVKPGN